MKRTVRGVLVLAAGMILGLGMGCRCDEPVGSGEIAKQARLAAADAGARSPARPPSVEDLKERAELVEPPDVEINRTIYLVIAGRAAAPEQAAALFEKVAAVPTVPIGYPAVEQARARLDSGDGFLVVAGKFAQKGPASRLARRLEDAGLPSPEVVLASYRHDRYRPALNEAAGPWLAQVFAEVPGAPVAVLDKPAGQAVGRSLADGALVTVLDQAMAAGKLWYRIEGGALPASRALVRYNVFPAATGSRAVLGVELGCPENLCRWDYWLVETRFAPRRLLAAAADRMPHAFSADGQRLAFAASGHPVQVVDVASPSTTVDLGPGTSPSWASDGRAVLFRRPGIDGQRDEVAIAAPPGFSARTLVDFEGEPFYPADLGAYPSAVEIGQEGDRLAAIFYRPVVKLGRKQVQRWLVEFDADGKVLGKKLDSLTEYFK